MTDDPEQKDMGPIEATVRILTSQAGAFGNISDLVHNIKTVHATILGLSSKTAAEPEPVALVPAVPIRKSITPDYIVCLEDGKKFKSLKRHLRTHYDLSPEEYRQKWGLPADYPMTAPSYSATRSKLAKDNGLGTKR